jgi:DNA polymerase-3 subunit delta'
MQHPDLLLVKADEVGGTLKIDQVREVQRGLALAPYESPYKLALFLRFEQANPNAANALLKTLEEPPPQVILILTARDTETLLPTIVSRCEVIRLRPLPLQEVSQGLQEIWGIPEDEVNLLAHLSNGRPGYAAWLYQNPEHRERRAEWLSDHQRLLSENRVERFHYAENLSKDKTEFLQIIQTWLTLWRDVMLKTSGAQTPITNLELENDIEQLANSTNLDTAKQMVANLELTQSQLERNTNARLTAEVLLINLPFIP